VHVARGSIEVNGKKLAAGDALKTDAADIRLEGGEHAEILLFDLPQ
jgi:quercetin 2,3-dioxygenase